ncbi:MAG: pyruvate kinase [Myxococcota bacterium]
MSDLQGLPEVFEAVRALREQVLLVAAELERKWQPAIEREDFRDPARNLACYLALRGHDLRELQLALTRFGLSSLGRSESRVKSTLDALTANLAILSGQRERVPGPYPDEDEVWRGARAIEATALQLFGESQGERQTRILVTLPSEARGNVEFMRNLLLGGAECVRINCAHDDAEAWLEMLNALRRAELELESTQRTRVLMDLGGPKVRTLRPRKQEGEPLHVGDKLWLTRAEPGALKAHKKHPLPVVGCTLPQALDRLAVGHRVFIDDGQLGAHVVETGVDGAVLEVFQAPDHGRKVRSDKGINFPDTEFEVSPLTDKDRADLEFVARHADMVGYSFVQQEADIDALLEELVQRETDEHRAALVLKIETKLAVRNLPGLLIRSAGKRPTAVMIARGDLAVELGFRRMAEMQEEILWLCEAAHVPVIWATQVLETLAKEGLPTRAEVTDAAMASRAECVMLNKGPHVVDAIRLLADVLSRMQGHQYKKSARLRILHSWESLTQGSERQESAPTSRAAPTLPGTPATH